MGKNTPVSDRRNKYSRAKSEKNTQNPMKVHNAARLIDVLDKEGNPLGYKRIEIQHLYYKPQESETESEMISRRLAEAVRFDNDGLFNKSGIDIILPKKNKESLDKQLLEDVVRVIIRLKETENTLLTDALYTRTDESGAVIDRETEAERMQKIFVVRGALEYARQAIKRDEKAISSLRLEGYSELFRLDVPRSKQTYRAIEDKYQNDVEKNNRIKVNIPKHSAEKQSASFVVRNPNTPESLKELGDIVYDKLKLP